MREAARCLLAVWLLLGAAARAEESAAPGVTGSSGRFRAFGPDSGQNLQLVAWAEHLGLQLEEWIGVPLRWTGSESILFRCRPAATGELARFTLRETPAGLAAAEIEVVGFATLDQEDLQEEVARLLVHRMVGGRAGAAPPAWFTTGVAQLVTPSTRERDFADVLRRWREGKEDRVADVLGWHRLPRGRWGGKASAAAVVAWLADQPAFSALQAAMFERWRTGAPVTPEWLASRLPGVQGEADLEKAFDLWLLARADDPVFVGWTAHIMGRLRDTLKPSPQFIRAGNPADGVPGLDRYPEFAGEAWMRAAIQDQIRRLGLLLPGQPAEFTAAVRAYQAYLEAVLSAVPARSGTPARRPSERAVADLAALLGKARALQNAFEGRTALRLAWMDEAERQLDPPPAAPAPAAPAERTELQRYVDRFDPDRKAKP